MAAQSSLQSSQRLALAPNPSVLPPVVPNAWPNIQGKPSFADMVARPSASPRFPEIQLAARQFGVKDGVPSISFTAAEYQAVSQRFSHTLIVKFQIGRPPFEVVKQTMLAAWKLVGRVTISSNWDDRHVVIILDSEKDVTAVLTNALRRIGHTMFRLFRWTPEYNPKKEATTITKWIRFPGLPMEMFDRAILRSIVSSFAIFLDSDARTKEMDSLNFARACVELDVTKPVPGKVWINLPDNKGFFQDIVVEGGLKYCSKCRIHGHEVSSCRKAVRKVETRDMKPMTSSEKEGNLAEIHFKSKQNPTEIKHKNNSSAEDTSSFAVTIQQGPDTKCTKSITHVGQEEWVEVRRKKGARTVQFIDKNPGDKPNPTILEQAIISTEVAEGEIDTNGLEEEQQDSRPKDSIKKGIEITVEEAALKETNVLPEQVHVDKVVEEETSPVEKNGDLPEVGDLTSGSAHEEMREQDRGSVAEVVTATNVIPSSDSSEDYVVHTREDGSIYCDVFGGKRFQNNEDLAKFVKENGFVIKDVPIITIEESGKGGEDREAIRNSDNESCDQVDQVDSQVPIISSQQRTRHRKKKGSRSSIRSCPKKKDDDFVWP